MAALPDLAGSWRPLVDFLSFILGDTGHWPLLPLADRTSGSSCAILDAGCDMAHRMGRNVPSRLIWFVLFLGLTEWARGYVATGFPWNAPGYLFSTHLSLLQGAGLVGLYGLTFLALFVAVAPALWRAGTGRLALVAIATLPLIAGYGVVTLNGTAVGGATDADAAQLPWRACFRRYWPAVQFGRPCPAFG